MVRDGQVDCVKQVDRDRQRYRWVGKKRDRQVKGETDRWKDTSGEIDQNVFHHYAVCMAVCQSQSFIQSLCSWSARGGASLFCLSGGGAKL